ncbi:MAG TPA: beta-galactosidase trimerization domain-containing protein, partial [Ignavibacteriales bacterium]|nr:beta-galactosidase trimerization domain-containing protein [Ignavibacteriales bacterium]
DLPYINEGDKVRGTIIKETLISEGAEVIARYSTGEAAITLSQYGKGKAILIGSYLGLSFFRNENLLNGELIASLVEMNAQIEKPYVFGNQKVRADLLKGKDDKIMLIVQNLKHQASEVMLRLPLKDVKCMKEQFTGEDIKLIQDGDGSVVSVKLEGKEVRVYCA